jgi:hypothetical protein
MPLFIKVYDGLKSCTSLLENVRLRVPPSNLRKFSLSCDCPSNNIALLLGAAMLPTKWVKISEYLHLEAFLLIRSILLIVHRTMMMIIIIIIDPEVPGSIPDATRFSE